MLLDPYRFGGGGGGGVAPKWDASFQPTGNPWTFSNADATVAAAGGWTSSPGITRGTVAINGGKWYWEVLLVNVIDGGGTTNGAGASLATVPDGISLVSSIGAEEIGLWVSGDKWPGGTASGTGTFADGDVMMFAIDKDAAKIWVGKNGTWVGNPAAGTGAAQTGSGTANPIWPAVCPWTGPCEFTIQGAGNSTYSAPSGFTPYSS